MPVYMIDIEKKAVSIRTFNINAEDELTAIAKAKYEAKEDYWNLYDINYNVMNVEQLKGRHDK